MKQVIIPLAATLAILNGQAADQPTPAFNFRALVSTGAIISGHEFGPETTIDGVALNDAGEVAFVARWSESADEKTVVSTSKRILATSGEVVDGKRLARITADSLAYSNSGHVAFEAVYADSTEHTGVFVDQHFALALTTAGTANDFVLTEDGHVTAKAVAAAPTTPAATTKTDASQKQSGSGLSHFRLNQKFADMINSHSPIYISPTITSPQQAPQPKPAEPKPASAPAQPPAQPAQAAACPLPAFPYPSEWQVGAQMSGPVTSNKFDSPANGRTYQSPFFDKMSAPFRSIQFGSDCHPLLIAIGDNAMHGRFEIWTPNGLLTYTRPDGFLQLDGVSGKVPPGPLVRTDITLRINHRGQLVVPVKFDGDSFVILLATPAGGSR